MRKIHVDQSSFWPILISSAALITSIGSLYIALANPILQAPIFSPVVNVPPTPPPIIYNQIPAASPPDINLITVPGYAFGKGPCFLRGQDYHCEEWIAHDK